ncbi:MAG: biotin/lipoyl-binding carrier protein [Ilumatobacteraceae bacterium]
MSTVDVKAEITGTVWLVSTEPGAAVRPGDELVILESMKMEIPVVAPTTGTVVTVHVEPTQLVQDGDVIVTIEVSS